MSVLLLVSICLCCHVFKQGNRKTVLSFKGDTDGLTCRDLEITAFKQDSGGCSVTVKRVDSSGNISCPDGTFSLSKPALAFNQPYSSSQQLVLSCPLATPPYMFGKRSLSLATPLQTGSVVTIIATPLVEESIIIYFQTDSLDRPLIYTVGFDYTQMKRVTVISYIEYGRHGTQELHQDHFPYEVNREFNTTITVRHKDYMIYVDGIHMYTFEFKIPNSQVTKISIFGKMSLNSVIIK